MFLDLTFCVLHIFVNSFFSGFLYLFSKIDIKTQKKNYLQIYVKTHIVEICFILFVPIYHIYIIYIYIPI